MKRLAAPLCAVIMLLTVTQPVRAADNAMDTVDAQLLRRVELLFERSEAERRRLEGEAFIREQQLRATYEARVRELERRLAAGGAAVTGAAAIGAGTATEQELIELRRQVAVYAGELAALRQSATPPADGTRLREENAKLAGELQRLMLVPDWPAEVMGEESGNAGVLNVNQAAREQLLVVPGMTEAGVDFIVWYRDRVGPFIGISELRLVPDATPELFSRWRRLLRVE